MKRFQLVLIAAACGVALSGCAAQIMRSAQSSCAAYGFNPGTDAYAQCVQQEVAQRRAAINQAFINAGRAMQGAGAALQQPYQPPSQQQYQPPPRLGGDSFRVRTS